MKCGREKRFEYGLIGISGVGFGGGMCVSISLKIFYMSNIRIFMIEHMRSQDIQLFFAIKTIDYTAQNKVDYYHPCLNKEAFPFK